MCHDGDIPSAFTNWFCMHVDPHKRFESEGETLPVSKDPIYNFLETCPNFSSLLLSEQLAFGNCSCGHESQPGR